MSIVAPILLVALAIALALVIAYTVSYNRLVGDRQQVSDAWAAIEVELERRHVLVPQLVAAVDQTAVHERTLLVEIARRHDAAAAAPHTAAAASEWEPPLAAAISQVVALRERYPRLNSHQNFLALQRELAITEDRLAAARRYYNTRVERLNRRIDAFPSALVARRHRFAHADFFDL